jgi:hypothetical protein
MMASKLESDLTPEALEAELELLSKKLDRLRVIYEQFFLGVEKMAPYTLQKDVVIGFHRLGQERIRSAASKFKYQSLVQKFSSYKAYWARTQREIEEGTYKRHVQRVQRREQVRTEHGELSAHDLAELRVIRETLGDEAANEAESKRRAELLAESRQPAGAPARTARGAMAPDDANNRGDAPTYSAPAPAVTAEGQAALDFMREAFGEEAARLPKAAPPEALRGMSAEEVARKAEALKALRARLGGADRPAVGAPIRQSREEIRDRQVYEKWVAAKRSVGDRAGLVSFDSLRQSMARQAEALREKHPGKEVGFDVVVKDGKAYLKPIPKP